jgi:hypothetical protein
MGAAAAAAAAAAVGTAAAADADRSRAAISCAIRLLTAGVSPSVPNRNSFNSARLSMLSTNAAISSVAKSHSAESWRHSTAAAHNQRR